MANYNTIEGIVASVDNATKLINNTKYDDNSYNVTGVDWFSYGGSVAGSIYANGNGWIGFGSASEHLKVNRRDMAMWNLWREEGTYCDTYRFLRIRWNGYSIYNTTVTSYILTFDVILFDTGDIMLYVADVPSGDYNGTFSLGSVSYNAPTVDNRYVTFYIQSDGTYVIDYAPIVLDVGTKKYIVRDGETLYTVTDGALHEITGELSAEFFLANGVDTIPDGALLITLSAPEVLCWTDADTIPTLTATVQGTPTEAHSIVSDNIRIGHESIYGITSVEADATEGARFLLSFDGGLWMVYDTDSETFIASDVGMTATELVAIPTDAWTSVVNSAQTMKLKATIGGLDTVTKVQFNFDNEPPVLQAAESEG